jgi:hypothetical protein
VRNSLAICCVLVLAFLILVSSLCLFVMRSMGCQVTIVFEPWEVGAAGLVLYVCGLILALVVPLLRAK